MARGISIDGRAIRLALGRRLPHLHPRLLIISHPSQASSTPILPTRQRPKGLYRALLGARARMTFAAILTPAPAAEVSYRQGCCMMFAWQCKRGIYWVLLSALSLRCIPNVSYNEQSQRVIVFPRRYAPCKCQAAISPTTCSPPRCVTCYSSSSSSFFGECF